MTDLLGKKFKYGGRGPDAYDCYGLAMEVFKRYGKDIPDYGFSDKRESIHLLIEEFSKQWEKVSIPLFPSIVTFYIHRPYISHIGVVISRDKFIHILEQSSVTIERLSQLEWNNKIAGYYTWKN